MPVTPPLDPEYLQALLNVLAYFAAFGSVFGVATCMLLLTRNSHRRKTRKRPPHIR